MSAVMLLQIFLPRFLWSFFIILYLSSFCSNTDSADICLLVLNITLFIFSDLCFFRHVKSNWCLWRWLRFCLFACSFVCLEVLSHRQYIAVISHYRFFFFNGRLNYTLFLHLTTFWLAWKMWVYVMFSFTVRPAGQLSVHMWQKKLTLWFSQTL